MAASADDVLSMVFFARVVESQSFSGAAARMSLSKSAVSSRISRLEERLGTRLLNRTTRRLSLTEAGLAFYKRCARIAAEADEAAEAVSDLSRVVKGTLRVNAPVVFAATHLAGGAPLAAGGAHRGRSLHRRGARGLRRGAARTSAGRSSASTRSRPHGGRLRPRCARSSTTSRRTSARGSSWEPLCQGRDAAGRRQSIFAVAKQAPAMTRKEGVSIAVPTPGPPST